MKVLHVNYYDLKGGAAIGVNRLHNALLDKGLESKILVSEKTSNDEKIIGPVSTLEQLKNQARISLARFVKRNLMKTSNKETFSFNYLNTNILDKINNFDSDLVHLHWIGNEMVSISQLKKIKKPIVWTFWDMWPICGAEHHSSDNRHIEGYNNNNRPENESGLDLNKIVWNNKKKNLNFDFIITTPSQWFFEIVKKSFLFKDKEIHHIPLNIDCSIWRKRDKNLAKEIFDIDTKKKVLLFGSATSTDDRKGFDFLIKLFKEKKLNNYQLLIFGEKPKNLKKLEVDYKYLGRIKDSHTLTLLYSLADILLMPSKIELFGQIGMEANACGTPAIIFENTGASDYIKHKFNGYISKYLDVEDFKQGIDYIINDENNYETISQNCQKYIKDNFNNESISSKFIEIYKKLIKKK